jgi:hypothetical protein
VGTARAAVAASAVSPAGVSRPEGAGSFSDGRDLVGVAHGDAVERAKRDRAVFVVVGASSFSEVGASRPMFAEIWRQGLLEYDEVVGIDWSFLAADGALTKAPLGGPKTGPNPTDRAKRGRSARSSPTPQGSRSALIMTARTATITSC